MICTSSKVICGGNDFRDQFLKEDRLSSGKAGDIGAKIVDMVWIAKSPQSLLLLIHLIRNDNTLIRKPL